MKNFVVISLILIIYILIQNSCNQSNTIYSNIIQPADFNFLNEQLNRFDLPFLNADNSKVLYKFVQEYGFQAPTGVYIYLLKLSKNATNDFINKSGNSFHPLPLDSLFYESLNQDAPDIINIENIKSLYPENVYEYLAISKDSLIISVNNGNYFLSDTTEMFENGKGYKYSERTLIVIEKNSQYLLFHHNYVNF